MKVALVHEKILPQKWGGAERVLKQFIELYPEADIIALVADRAFAKKQFPKQAIITSTLQEKPGALNNLDLYRPLMPMAVESLDLRPYELVISISHSFEKAVITNPGQSHLCYCLTPPRYLWLNPEEHFRRSGLGPLRALGGPVLTYLRMFDRASSLRVDEFAAISKAVQARIKKFYRREAEVIYPGVDTKRFTSVRKFPARREYYLLVARLEPHKEAELAIRAFNTLPDKLLIVGEGKEARRLRSLAGSNIELIGSISDLELIRLYQGARGLIFPQEEDFGLVAVEAQAAGTPVVAFRAGGAVETVVEGKTGLFFDVQEPEALVAAVERSKAVKWNERTIVRNAARFDVSRFKKEWQRYVAKKLEDRS